MVLNVFTIRAPGRWCATARWTSAGSRSTSATCPSHRGVVVVGIRDDLAGEGYRWEVADRPHRDPQRRRDGGQKRQAPQLRNCPPAAWTRGGRLSESGSQPCGGLVTPAGPSPRLSRDSPSGPPNQASTAILGPRNSAHNSGHSAHARPAEMRKRAALGLIYLQSRRSTY